MKYKSHQYLESSLLFIQTIAEKDTRVGHLVALPTTSESKGGQKFYNTLQDLTHTC